MNILCIGDVVGSTGIDYLMKTLPSFKKSHSVDFVIANGENSYSGIGLTPTSAKSLFDCGVDVITSGNHAFKRRESYDYYDSCHELVRPANFPEKTTPGRGYTVIDMLKYQVCVINLIGTLFLEPLACPFETIDRIIDETSKYKIRILDFHAEATSEKKALGYYVDGRLSAVFGTHTHVQTADEAILQNGTGYITDVGMTGASISVLGVKKEDAIALLKEKLPVKLETAQGECHMDCIIFGVDEKTGKTFSVERFSV